MLINILFLSAFINLQASYDKLTYKETVKESMSKYQRINYIEGYLSNLKGSIQGIQKNVQKESLANNKKVEETLKEIMTKITLLELKVKKIEDNLKPKTKEDL